MQAITHPDELDFAPFRGPVQAWLRLRAERAIPRLEDWQIAHDPLAEYRMEATITPPLSVQYGYVGAALEKLYGKPLREQNLETLYNDWFRKRAYEGYKFMLQQGGPCYERRAFNTLIRKIGYHKIHLPFGDDTITHAITYIIPMQKDMHKRADWEDIVKATPWL